LSLKDGIKQQEYLNEEVLVNNDTTRNPALIASLLKRIKAFRQFLNLFSVSEILLKNASETIYHSTFKKGDLLIKKGDESNLFYGLIKGKIEVVVTKEIQQLDEDNNIIYKTSRKTIPINEGSIIGELGLIYNDLRSANIEAASDVDVFVVDRKCYEKNFKQSFLNTDKKRRALMKSVFPEFEDLTKSKLRLIMKKLIFKVS
jgi:CRP-like cAMP-binding protein